MFSSSNFRRCILFCVVLCLVQLSSCEPNTHQNITFQYPAMKPFRVFLKEKDRVEVNIFNTNAIYGIVLVNQNDEVQQTQQGHCFKGDKCQMKYEAVRRMSGWILIQIIEAYEYNYEIKINDRSIKAQRIHTLLWVGNFNYPFLVQQKNITMQVYYQSKSLSNIVFNFIDKSYQVEANKTRSINYSISPHLANYQFLIAVNQINSDDLLNSLPINVSVLIPNQMLKGCNGLNTFNEKIRACGKLQQKSLDTLTIDRYGSFLNFNVYKKQSTKLRLTLVNLVQFMRQGSQNYVQGYFIKDPDHKQIRQRTFQYIVSNFKYKSQICHFKNTQCTMELSLQKGEYCFIPFFTTNVIPGPFVYLFERLNAKSEVVQNHYAVLPTQYSLQTSKETFQFFNGALVQFTSTTDELMQLQIISNKSIVMTDYLILQLRKNKSKGQLLVYNIEQSQMVPFSQDMHKITILTQISPHYTNFLYFKLHSKQFYLTFAQMGFGNQYIAATDPSLDDTVLQFKVINGKFPYRKIQQIDIENYEQQQQIDNNEQEQKQQEQQEEQDFNDEEDWERQDQDDIIDKPEQNIKVQALSEIKILLIILIGTIFLMFVILMVMFIKNRKNQKVLSELQARILISENNIIGEDKSLSPVFGRRQKHNQSSKRGAYDESAIYIDPSCINHQTKNNQVIESNNELSNEISMYEMSKTQLSIQMSSRARLNNNSNQ